jgi:hypothetical protein
MRRALTVLGVCVGLTAAGPAAQQPAQAPPPAPPSQATAQRSGQAAQPPPIIFKTEVNYVEVDAVVTDA